MSGPSTNTDSRIVSSSPSSIVFAALIMCWWARTDFCLQSQRACCHFHHSKHIAAMVSLVSEPSPLAYAVVATRSSAQRTLQTFTQNLMFFFLTEAGICRCTSAECYKSVFFFTFIHCSRSQASKARTYQWPKAVNNSTSQRNNTTQDFSVVNCH